MPKATYMYWQKRFGKADPDKELSDGLFTLIKAGLTR